MSSEILDYIGLNIDCIQKNLMCEKPIFKTSKAFDNSEIYRVYKDVQIKDLDILISDSDRTTDISKRFEISKPINEFIKNDRIEFEKLIEKTSISEIENLENLQDRLQGKIPFFIKYEKNYLWQIYYSREENKYFMLFPSKEGETSVLFYIIKKKLENPNYKIFVPICKSDYDERLLSKKEISDLENYIWAFTENWPITYEVTRNYLDDKRRINIEKQNDIIEEIKNIENKPIVENKIYIVGKAKLDEQLESKYRIEIKKREEALNLYMLAKALFILVTETDYKEKIKVNITEDGGLEFYYIDDAKGNRNINITNLSDFISEQVILKQGEKKEILNEINEKKNELEKIKLQIQKENELFVKQEKQIVLFLECKKSFFKKITYFFKSTRSIRVANLTGKHLKDSENNKISEVKNEEDNKNSNKNLERDLNENDNSNLMISQISNFYTLADLVKICMQNLSAKNNLKDIKNDLKILILKQQNLEKKIENAKLYLKEIEKHKKSIFEFWKFSNKDERNELEEGNISDKNFEEKHLQCTYNLNEDMEEFAQKVDELQRRKLSIDECNAIFICNYALNSLNAIVEEQKILSEFKMSEKEKSKNEILEKLDNIILNELERLKENYKGNQSTEIFGELVDDYTKIKTLKDKEHRENKKSVYSILKIRKDTSLSEYKNILYEYVKLLNEALKKVTSIADIPIYYKCEDCHWKNEIEEEYTNKELFNEEYIVGDINPSKLIIEDKNNVIYKINATSDMHLLYFSNIIFYDNYNKTLPSGMDESTMVLIKINQPILEENDISLDYKEEKNNVYSKEKIGNQKEFNILIEKNQFEVEIKKLKIITIK